MKKVIKLNEADLEKLVQKIIREEGEQGGQEMSQGSEAKTGKVLDSTVFNQLLTTLKSKSADEQVNIIMTLLKQMDLKGGFGVKFKQALKTLS
jgi:hypothetical protein